VENPCVHVLVAAAHGAIRLDVCSGNSGSLPSIDRLAVQSTGKRTVRKPFFSSSVNSVRTEDHAQDFSSKACWRRAN
jgi:hypothetical protein